MTKQNGPSVFLIWALTVWGMLLSLGYWGLVSYANTQGRPAEAKSFWPAKSTLRPDLKHPTLLVFAHPRCPCSRATLGELERLMVHLDGKARVVVVFDLADGLSANEVDGPLWKMSHAIPGVETFADLTGTEAALFGAKVSGQVLIYRADGVLAFSGGITPQRGHMGDSDGRAAILSFFKGGAAPISTSPVYGCSLRRPGRKPGEKTGETK